MAYEIDFLTVGDGERSGDAIAMRFGPKLQPGSQSVLIIDGGTKESGKALVEHVRTHYGTEVVNAVFCTHSDADHASGLTEVIETLDVQALWMHLPWNHVKDIDELLKDANMSASSAVRHFKKSLDNAHELVKLAAKNGIDVFEPFSDTTKASDNFTILGPSKTYYEELLCEFRCAPGAIQKPPLLQKVVTAVQGAIKWVAEEWNKETLTEPQADECSAENNSSVILLFSDGNDRFLFTSDAGVPALTQAVARATAFGIDLRTVKGIQIPHHGSKHNVGPAILNSLLGPKTNTQQPGSKTAIVSAARCGAPKHPSKRVVNAFLRRDRAVFCTANGGMLHHSGGNARGWGNASALPFSPQVEE